MSLENPATEPSLSDEQKKYLLEEMKVARRRIDEEIKTMNQFEILSIGAIWALYWALLSFGITDRAALAVLTAVPFIICVYGLVRYRAHADVVKIREKYIKKKVELAMFSHSSRGGLVHYYDRKKRSLLKQARYIFWVILSLLSFGILVVAMICPEKITQIHSTRIIQKSS